MNVNSERAYEYIRKQILNGEFQPGHPLMAEHLSEKIGVSRTPVREALHDLEKEGLVTIKSRLGASVKKMDDRELIELCELRLGLEVHAAGLAALRRSESDLNEILFALESLRGLSERLIAEPEDDMVRSEVVHADVRFHIAIITAARNNLIKKEILRLHLIHRAVVTKPKTVGKSSAADRKSELNAIQRAAVADHEEIYAAIARKDPAAAKARMERHLQDAIDNIMGASARVDSTVIPRELTPEEMAYIS
jgi:DNA-binding GntR family transcriptional regulator